MGLRIFDASGNTVMDETVRLPQVIGVELVTGAGSLNHDDLLLGTPFAIVNLWVTSAGLLTAASSIPEVTFSGDTMTWTDGLARIIYGVH